MYFIFDYGHYGRLWYDYEEVTKKTHNTYIT
jgi:hypothetical protein